MLSHTLRTSVVCCQVCEIRPKERQVEVSTLRMASFAEGKGDEGVAVARPALTVPGQADAILERMENMEDLEPDNITPDEAEKLTPLLAGVLEALGRNGIPKDWTRHLYVRSALLRFLRGRNGKVAAAIVMLTEAIQW